MNKRQIIFIVSLTVVVMTVLSFFVGSTISSVNQQVIQFCFDELSATSQHLANDLYENVGMDSTILTAMAAIIASSKEPSKAELCEIMNSYNNPSSYVSYVELLRPDNTLLGEDGTIRDVAGAFDFAADAQKGAYISDIKQSTLNPEERVIRNAVPVVKDGETIYILYGVVRLSEVAEKYKTYIYDGHAYVYLLDSYTGDFLLDTWHKSLGNVQDFGKRQMLPGYSFEKAFLDMKKGLGGNIGFVSQTTGQILYMHYEPVGINSWTVMVTVEEKYALRESGAVSFSLYLMAGVIGAVMLFYMACVSFCLVMAYRQVRKLGTEDQTTGLQNRNAYDQFIADNQQKTFASITCIYIDVNGLHEINNKFGHAFGDQMLRTIAEALQSKFRHRSIYRIGGDEFVIFCEEGDLEICGSKLEAVVKQVELHDYHIACGLVCYKNETGVGRIIQDADAKMLENKRLYYAEQGGNPSR